MAIEEALMAHPEEFARIFVHELFHFAWLRLGNAKRRSYEGMIARELRRRLPNRDHILDQWRGDLAVGTHGQSSSQIGLLPY